MAAHPHPERTHPREGAVHAEVEALQVGGGFGPVETPFETEVEAEDLPQLPRDG